MGIECKVCDDEGWVCENHADRPWNRSERGCECGAGMPCEACNPCNELSPPRLSPDFVVDMSAEERAPPKEPSKPN